MSGESKCRHEYTIDQLRRSDREDIRQMGYDTSIVIFGTITTKFFDEIEESFNPNVGPIKYRIKYRAYDNSPRHYTYSDETGIVRCETCLDEGVNEINKVFFNGEDEITTRLFEEFKKFALDQNLNGIISEALKHLPPRLLTSSEYPYEELKDFAKKNNIKYVDTIELR